MTTTMHQTRKIDAASSAAAGRRRALLAEARRRRVVIAWAITSAVLGTAAIVLIVAGALTLAGMS